MSSVRAYAANGLMKVQGSTYYFVTSRLFDNRWKCDLALHITILRRSGSNQRRKPRSLLDTAGASAISGKPLTVMVE
jgi:hypothetical protein